MKKKTTIKVYKKDDEIENLKYDVMILKYEIKNLKQKIHEIFEEKKDDK